MSVKRILVILAVAIVSNTVLTTLALDVAVKDTAGAGSTTLRVPSAHTTINADLLDVLKNFQMSSPPDAGQKMPVTETAPTSPPPANDRISIMHFPAAPALGSINGATPNLMVPGVIHQGPFGPNIRIPDHGYNPQMAEPSPSLMQSRGSVGNSLPVPVPPPIAQTGPSSASVTAPDQQSSSVAISSPSSPDPAIVKIEPVGLSHNQELIKLLTDLRMAPVSRQEPPAAQGQNQMLANGPTTRPVEIQPVLSPGASSSKVPQSILGPNQTPLDYLLSSSSPVHQLNSIPGYSPSPNTNTNTWPTVHRQPPSTAKPRPNLEFVKYLLTLPRYQQALNDLIKAQSSIQT
ncbi:hypothetical protein QTP88_012621 [Uroleucon formosanum]